MITKVFRLVAPYKFCEFHKTISFDSNYVIVKPEYLSICKADQRYFWGDRPSLILSEKLPMALIHEMSGTVVADTENQFQTGEKVVVYPTLMDEESENFDNYAPNTRFCSSNCDGFMMEYLSVHRKNILPIGKVPMDIAVLTEFISVACHAKNMFESLSHSKRNDLAILGDGSMSFALALVLKQVYSNINLTIIGRHDEKLSFFSFADKRVLVDNIPSDLSFDHCFECVGGRGQEEAMTMMMNQIRPLGSIILLGVSEINISIPTRIILEKGIRIVGCTRSTISDMEEALHLLDKKQITQRLKNLVSEIIHVSNIKDAETAFKQDKLNTFKTVIRWNV